MTNGNNDTPTPEDAPDATPAEETLPPGADESAIVEQPTTADLAAELTDLEDAAATTETAPAPDTSEAPADPQAVPTPSETDPPDDGTDPPPADPDAPLDGTDPPPDETTDQPGDEADRTIAPPIKTQALSTSQDEKKTADATRRKEAIAAADRPELPVDEEVEARKAEIYDELEDVQEELEEALAAVEACKGRARELMVELYPHTGKSDKLVDAVRGHIAAQKIARRQRAANPARIAEILKAAGRSPIDQAFHVQRARGMARPTRRPITPAKPANGDGSSAKPGSE